MLKVSVLGSGNLGTHMVNLLNDSSEVKLVQWYSRSKIDDQEIEVTNDITMLKNAEIYILCVSDDSISDLSNQLIFNNKLVVHTSGSTTYESINRKNRRGVFYPLQSFSMKRITNFSNLPICIEASNDNDLRFLEKLTIGLKANPIKINSQQRKSLHLAAVLVNNFTNHIFTQAEFICKQNDLSFDLLKPLIQETVNKLDDLKPKEAQTGPAIRGDKRTIEAHLEIIKDLELEKLYNLLTNSITNYYNK